MKIKQAMEKTGLTERTIRYYTQQSLIAPSTIALRERTYLDFSDADVENLTHISVLRKAGFSVKDIGQMLQTPAAVLPLTDKRCEQLRTQEKQNADLLLALTSINPRACTDMGSLARQLSQPTTQLSLPKTDVCPDFSKFDAVDPAVRQRLRLAYDERMQKVLHRARAITAVLLGLQLPALAALLLFLPIRLWAIVALVMLLLAAFLAAGYPVARYLYAGCCTAALFAGLWFLTTISTDRVTVPQTLFFIGCGAWLSIQLASALYFFGSKELGEWMYARKNP